MGGQWQDYSIRSRGMGMTVSVTKQGYGKQEGAAARLQYKVERDGYDSISDKTRIGETGWALGSGKG